MLSVARAEPSTLLKGSAGRSQTPMIDGQRLGPEMRSLRDTEADQQDRRARDHDAQKAKALGCITTSVHPRPTTGGSTKRAPSWRTLTTTELRW